MSAPTDLRWERLKRVGVRCASCDEVHVGPFDLSKLAPDFWPHDEKYEENSALQLESDFLSSDFCVLNGEHFAIRTVLELPIQGVGERFGFGVWSSLSRDNFDRYVETFDSGDQARLGQMFSWLMNELRPAYQDTYAMKSTLTLVDGRQRPKVLLHDIDHPLSLDQRSGITLDRMLDIYAHNGHDLRPSLSGTEP